MKELLNDELFIKSGLSICCYIFILILVSSHFGGIMVDDGLTAKWGGHSVNEGPCRVQCQMSDRTMPV